MHSSVSSDNSTHKAMVVSADPLASQAGVRMLEQCGNAVDAAVASALTLGVTSFAFSGIGGGGFMIIHQKKSGKNIVVDYRETSPLSASSNMFKLDSNGELIDNENSVGYNAIATPATLLGLSFALDSFGSKSFREVSKTAEHHARKGFEVSRFLSRAIQTEDSTLKFRRFAEAARITMRKGSTLEPLLQLDRISLPNLGSLLRIAGNNDITEFYINEFASSVSRVVAKGDGILSEEDFGKYEVKVREPLISRVEDYEIISLPPPSAGGICLTQALKMIFGDQDFVQGRFNSPRNIGKIAKCLGIVFEDRAKTVADPDYESVDANKLVSDSYISNLSHSSSDNAPATVSRDGSQTSHLTVVDREGNVVVLTESIECYFGSGIVVPEYDLFLNDTMHDFDAGPGTINSIKPRKRPRSSMSPTIMLRDGEPCLALGSAGGPRIISSVLQVILNVVRHGMPVELAVRSERIHFDGKFLYSENSSEKTKMELMSMGYVINDTKPDYFFGGVNAIQFRDGKILGGADPRRDGLALGC
jgi:gamma-glutamyltranspeptidase / glutathione hydrolase